MSPQPPSLSSRWKLACTISSGGRSAATPKFRISLAGSKIRIRNMSDSMKNLDLTLASPAANLACDESLLDACEDGSGPEVLRFWQAEQCFVVVGYSNEVAREVNVAACRRADLGIFRRCSGGGTVLQGL